MSKSLKGAMLYSVIFASTSSRPTVQSTHLTNKMGPTFWSIHLRTRIIVWSPQILSVRPGTKAIFKSAFVFKYVLLRSQIRIPRVLKKWSSSSFLQRTSSAFLIVSSDTHSVWPLGRVATLGYEDNGGRLLLEEFFLTGGSTPMRRDRKSPLSRTGRRIFYERWLSSWSWICRFDYFEKLSRLFTDEMAVAVY